MRILIAAGVTPTVGGVSSHINSLCRALRAAGHEAVVVTPLGVADEFKAIGPRMSTALAVFLRFPCGMVTAYVFSQYLLRAQMFKALTRSRFDAIHAQDVSAANAAWGLDRARGIPVVMTVHGYLAAEAVEDRRVPTNSPAHGFLLNQEEKAYTRAGVVITVTSRLSEHVVKHGAQPDKVVLMPNFVDVERFTERAGNRKVERQRLGLDDDDFVILCPRRLLPKYGAEFLIRALPALVGSEGRKPHVLVLGIGEQAGDLTRLAADLGVSGCLSLLGQIPNDRMPALYGAADVVVIPSVSSPSGAVEGCSMAVLEAMACGKPVIASAVGGLREIIHHEDTGILVPERDPVSLASSLLRLRDDSGLMSHLTESGLRYIQSERSSRAAAESLVSLYKRTAPVRRS
ncbi:MAG: glycosyltransferase family 4 protein [Ignavibacteriales bacterium]